MKTKKVLRTLEEHLKQRERRMLKHYQKSNPKNKGKKPFGLKD